jgi:hypothetical protein
MGWGMEGLSTVTGGANSRSKNPGLGISSLSQQRLPRALPASFKGSGKVAGHCVS